MRLFQLFDGDGDNIGLYHIKNDELEDYEATILLQENWDDEDDTILSENGIERVFVTEIHTIDN